MDTHVSVLIVSDDDLQAATASDVATSEPTADAVSGAPANSHSLEAMAASAKLEAKAQRLARLKLEPSLAGMSGFFNRKFK